MSPNRNNGYLDAYIQKDAGVGDFISDSWKDTKRQSGEMYADTKRMFTGTGKFVARKALPYLQPPKLTADEAASRKGRIDGAPSVYNAADTKANWANLRKQFSHTPEKYEANLAPKAGPAYKSKYLDTRDPNSWQSKMVAKLIPGMGFMTDPIVPDPNSNARKWLDGPASVGTGRGFEEGHSRGGFGIDMDDYTKEELTKRYGDTFGPTLGNWAEWVRAKKWGEDEFQLNKMNLAGGVIPLTKKRAFKEKTDQIEEAAARGDLSYYEEARTGFPEAADQLDAGLNEQLGKRIVEPLKKAAPWIAGAGVAGLGLYALLNKKKGIAEPPAPQQQAFLQQLDILRKQKAMMAQQTFRLPHGRA